MPRQSGPLLSIMSGKRINDRQTLSEQARGLGIDPRGMNASEKKEAIKDKKEELVEIAREKITPEEAKDLIMARWKNVLHTTVMEYVNRYERALISELENRYTKYCETLTSILDERDQAATQLDNYITELGYEK